MTTLATLPANEMNFSGAFESITMVGASSLEYAMKTIKEVPGIGGFGEMVAKMATPATNAVSNATTSGLSHLANLSKSTGALQI